MLERVGAPTRIRTGIGATGRPIRRFNCFVNTPRTSLVRWTLALMRPYRRAGRRPRRAVGFAEVALRALSPWPLKAVIDFVMGHDPLPAWLQALLVPLSANPQVQALAAILGIGLVTQLGHQGVLMLPPPLPPAHRTDDSLSRRERVCPTSRASRSRTRRHAARRHGVPPRGRCDMHRAAPAEGAVPGRVLRAHARRHVLGARDFDTVLALVAMSIAPLL